MSNATYMREAVQLAEQGMRSGRGGPFGCVVARRGEIVGRGSNRVTSTNALQTFQLTDCELYTSCEPCPMCLSAIYWARIPQVYYGNTRADAAAIGFDDEFIYQQVPLAPEARTVKMELFLRDEAQVAFQEWANKTDKIRY